jgi:isoleucyl-tRNA synthetase
MTSMWCSVLSDSVVRRVRQARYRVRQPLVAVAGSTVPMTRARAAVERHSAQIREELNIKKIEFLAPDAELVSYRIKPKLPELGKRHGKLIPAIRKALSECDGAALVRSHGAGESFDLEVDGQMLSFDAADVLVETESAEGYACAEEDGFLVGLDTHLDEALLIEGVARELVRTVQDARKQAGLEISDRITLRIEGSGRVPVALAGFRDYLMSETLASGWGESDIADAFTCEHKLDDERWVIHLARNSQGTSEN